MATKEVQDKISALEKQIEALKNRKAAMIAKASSARRKAETRAKIIIGAWFLSVAHRGPDEAKKLLASLEKADLRENDRSTLETAGVFETLKKIIADGKVEAKAESSKPIQPELK